MKAFECDKILNSFVNSRSKRRSLEQIKKGDENYCLLTWSFFKHHVCKIHDYLINSIKRIDGSVMQVFSCKNCDFKAPLNKSQMRYINFTRGKIFSCFDHCSFMADISSDDDRETDSEDIFKCGFCSFKASDLHRMWHHIDRKHSLTYLESKTFDSDKVMNRLKNNRSEQSSSVWFRKGDKTKHSASNMSSGSDCFMTDVSSNDDIETNSEETFKCGFCSFKASNLSRMRHHIDRKHSLTFAESNTFDKYNKSK